MSTFSILQREFESRHLRPIELIRFSGNPCHWPVHPEFIQSLKERIHLNIHLMMTLE